MTSRRTFLKFGVVGVAGASLGISGAGAKSGQKLICPPCGCSTDGVEFDAPGKCPACGMALVPLSAAAAAAPDRPGTGSGSFLLPGGRGREIRQIEVH